MRRFYATSTNITITSATIGPEEARHLRDVLRLREGDEAFVFDGEGREYLCIIKAISKKDSVLTIIKEIPPSAPESPLVLTLAAAILPGEKFDLVVQKAVELGVVSLHPLFTQRCEAHPESTNRRLDRWKKIALEASKQCGRAKLMNISDPCRVEDFLADAKSTADEETGLVFFSERDGTGFSNIRGGKQMNAVIGPKGGWENSELAAARDNGFSIVTFGGRVLRAETAAIAMSAILQHRFGDLS